MVEKVTFRTPPASKPRWAFFDGRVFDLDKNEFAPEPPPGHAYDLRTGEMTPLSELPGVFADDVVEVTDG
jgi:hypothetical protein